MSALLRWATKRVSADCRMPCDDDDDCEIGPVRLQGVTYFLRTVAHCHV